MFDVTGMVRRRTATQLLDDTVVREAGFVVDYCKIPLTLIDPVASAAGAPEDLKYLPAPPTLPSASGAGGVAPARLSAA